MKRREFGEEGWFYICDEREKRALLGKGMVIEERWALGTVTEERRYKEEREINIFLMEKREATNKLIFFVYNLLLQ